MARNSITKTVCLTFWPLIEKITAGVKGGRSKFVSQMVDEGIKRRTETFLKEEFQSFKTFEQITTEFFDIYEKDSNKLTETMEFKINGNLIPINLVFNPELKTIYYNFEGC